ncbi:YibE/F family protein [Camelliibacillus cellulosilyticus]|uniref:YibE/F family protein n=1 Tax=Camelliibacillus cellulosilyticus TaxID=2174486 RepID=A0ABV9GP89_9BACL
MNVVVNRLKQLSYKEIVFYIILVICFVSSMIFVYHNESFYHRPIAKVIKTTQIDATKMTDMNQNKDEQFTQRIKAKLTNGEEKGHTIDLTNKYSSSGAFDQKIKVGDELFVSIDKNTKGKAVLTGAISDVKRDKNLLTVAWIFIFILLIVGKRQGLLSVLSLAVNAAIITYALDVYVKHPDLSLLFICGICAVLFTVISLLLSNGFNDKTYAAIIATLLGTFSALFITYLVMRLTNETGLRYEEMQYLTRPYKIVFMAGLLIGSLGAVMDVAMTMSSSIFGLYEKNKDIQIKTLRTSGMDIGKDIMGTMTSILFFVYISGSIPMLILYLKNGAPLGYSLSMNLSLELARALAGGIGIVLTIPIGLYTTIFFVKRKRARS